MYSDKAFCEYVKKRGVKFQAVAEAMGITPSTLYRKRKGQLDFSRTEIQKCCDFFGVKELNRIFFAPDVA